MMLKQKIELVCYITNDQEKAEILAFQQQLLEQIAHMELYVPIKVYMEKELHDPLLKTPTPEGEAKALSLLSKRELEVMALLCDNYSIKKMALTLHISEHTVKKHIQNMKQKLGLEASGMELVFQLKLLRV
jgi:DNA-binding NarL/FixJ family response regulator